MTTAPDTDPRSLPSDADEPGGSPSTAAGTGGSGDGVNWLTAHEETVWRRWLAVSSRIPAALSSQLQSDSGLSLQDYDVLVMLNDSESSSCRITELAGLLDWERSRMSHHLTRMEKRGLIARSAAPDDGRAQLAQLTEAGRQALAAAAPGHLGAVRRSFFDALDAQDIEDLDRITSRIARKLDIRRPDCAPID